MLLHVMKLISLMEEKLVLKLNSPGHEKKSFLYE